MLAAFLPPYPFRGDRVPYLWWYYRLLNEWSAESAYFVTGRDYCRSVEHWHARWECSPDAQKRLGYSLPTDPAPGRHHYAWLDETRFDLWLANARGNPIEAFRHFLTGRDASFEQELRAMLAAAPVPIEAVLSICNVPALDAVCAELEIPVVHVELGPLRGPLYRETAYLDFRGVNGNTECAARYAAWGGRLRLHREDLKEFVARVDLAPGGARPDCDLGVVLQVEDDSNLVAFGNGMDNLGILTHARLRAAAQELQVSVRPHPGSVFAVRDSSVRIDDSPDSYSFVQRCAELITINSSVGLEAILSNKPVHAFGDSSFAFIIPSEDEPERMQRLAFYLLGYLVPFTLQLDPRYLRFRLGAPSEQSIILRHLEEYMKKQGLDAELLSELPPEQRSAVLVLFANQESKAQRALNERDQEIRSLRSSLSWRVTAPLRWLHQRIVTRSATR